MCVPTVLTVHCYMDRGKGKGEERKTTSVFIITNQIKLAWNAWNGAKPLQTIAVHGSSIGA